MDRPNIESEFRNLITPLTGEELLGLEASIKADKCRDALVIWNGTLLDGHNRLEICERLGIGYRTQSIKLPDRTAAMDWIDANQLARRNLTPAQQSLIRGRMYEREKKRHGGTRQASGQSDHLQKTAEKIAAKTGVSEKTVRRDAKRFQFVEELEKKHPEKAKAIREGKAKLTAVRREIEREQTAATPKLPDDKYRVIYADPPWKYRDDCSDGAVQAGGAGTHYGTMTIRELCARPVMDLALKNAVLFLWVPSPFLAECWPVIEAWGFKYKASFVWDKVRHNMGHYNSVRHELLLICTRGSCLPETRHLTDSVQSIERTARHSEKPEEFRKIIDNMYPNGKRIELFVRGTSPKGWDSWGDQKK